MTPHLQRAQLLIQQNRCADAERELGLALGQNPDDPWAHALLGFCLAERKAYNEARARGQQAIGLAPDSAPIRHLAARVQLKRNDLPEAERLFTEAIELDPQNDAAFAGRAAVHAIRKHWQKSLEDAEQALAIDPENVEATCYRAMAHRGLGRSEASFRDVQQALRVDPNDAYSHANLGWGHLQQSELKQAETHFREALRIDPSLESARIGVLETTKAKFPAYRWVLGYFLWMAKLTGQAQMGILIGLWVVNRVVRSAAEAYPAWAPVLLPITWFYLLFCVATWFIRPLGNATLLLHPFGRLALNRKEKNEAAFVGGLFFTVLGLLVGSFFDATGTCLLLAIAIGLPGLPIAMTWKFEHPQPKKIMLGLTAAVLLGEVAFFAEFAAAGGWITIPQPLAGLTRLGTQFFSFSPLVVLIMTNALAVKNWKDR